MLYVAVWYVSIHPVVMRVKEELRTALQFFFTLITTGRIETYQIATYSIRTLLKIDYWSPKHVELLNVMNKLIIKYCISCWITDRLQNDTWPIQYQNRINPFWLYNTFTENVSLNSVVVNSSNCGLFHNGVCKRNYILISCVQWLSRIRSW